MLEDVRRELESTVTPLLRGILEDTQRLFRQEIALAKVEVREDARRARDAFVGFSIGVLAGTLSFVFVCLALVYLLVEYRPDVPLWGSFAIMAAVLSVVGWFFTWRASRKARQIKGVPSETISSLSEGFQWMQRRV